MHKQSVDSDARYLELVKKGLTGALDVYFIENWRNDKQSLLNKNHHRLAIPGSTLTMLGYERLTRIQHIIRELGQQKIDGDILLAGCWRGGLAVFIKACLTIYEPTKKRKVYCADAFVGQNLSKTMLFSGKLLSYIVSLLPFNLRKKFVNSYYTKMGFPTGIKSTEDVDLSLKCARLMPWMAKPTGNFKGAYEIKEAFKRYQLLDDHVIFLEGWFSETLPKVNFDKLCLIYADGDMYDSTMDILNNAYEHLTEEGYAIIDDYGAFHDCALAVNDFRIANHIQEELKFLDEDVAYWKKRKRLSL